MTKTILITGPGEYRFTLSDGRHAYEIVSDDAGESIASQVRRFATMHRAVAALPLAAPAGAALSLAWRKLWERHP